MLQRHWKLAISETLRKPDHPNQNHSIDLYETFMHAENPFHHSLIS